MYEQLHSKQRLKLNKRTHKSGSILENDIDLTRSSHICETVQMFIHKTVVVWNLEWIDDTPENKIIPKFNYFK